jgi:hypothetical protein
LLPTFEKENRTWSVPVSLQKGARVSAFHFIFQPEKAETGKICPVRFHVPVTEASTGQREKNILSLKLAF